VPEVAGGRVRDEEALIVAGEVVAELHLALHRADDGEAHAADVDGLTDRVAPLKQLLARALADERDAATLGLVGRGQPPARRRDLVAHLTILGANTTYGSLHQAVAVGDWQPFHGLEAGVADIVRVRLDEIDVLFLEDDLLAGALSSSLLAGL